MAFPWDPAIEADYLDSGTLDPHGGRGVGGESAEVPPPPPLMSDLSENGAEHCIWVQRRASEHAVETLHHLDFKVARPMLRQFLRCLAFGNDPLGIDYGATAELLEQVTNNTDPTLLEELPFPLPTPPGPGPGVEKEFGGIPVVVRPILAPDFSMNPKKTAQQIWNREVIRILRVRIAHDRAVRMRKQYLRLAPRSLTSRAHFEETLSLMTREAINAGVQLDAESTERIVGAAAARSSAWWRDQMRWHLQKCDSVLQPRGSYLSPDEAPKQLFIWHEFDYWLRVALKELPTHFARSRVIAKTLAVLAGPALYHPPDLEQFARNIVERWRTRKASRAPTFAKAFMRSSITPFW
jgi:hypothetical protein